MHEINLQIFIIFLFFLIEFRLRIFYVMGKYIFIKFYSISYCYKIIFKKRKNIKKFILFFEMIFR